MNMYALNNMAYVETVLGRPLYTFIYLTSGVAGAFASFLFSKAPSLGASGAVLGIFGAFWMYFENNKPYLSKNARQIQSSIQQVILANIAIGFFIANVDNWCVDLPFCTSPVCVFLASNVMFCLLQN
jgi:membrane associated rhomboid family serine protease